MFDFLKGVHYKTIRLSVNVIAINLEAEGKSLNVSQTLNSKLEEHLSLGPESI